MKQKLIAYTLLIIGLISFFFFYNYRGYYLEHTTLLWIVSLAMFVIGFFMLRNSLSSKESKTKNEQQRVINELLEYGNRITVDLTTCEIKSNSFIDTDVDKERDDVSFIKHFADPGILKQISSFNQISGDSNYKTENKLKEYSIFLFKTNYLGEDKLFVSPVILKDKITLEVLLSMQKQTTLYISKEDKQKYYFDLGFLDE